MPVLYNPSTVLPPGDAQAFEGVEEIEEEDEPGLEFDADEISSPDAVSDYPDNDPSSAQPVQDVALSELDLAAVSLSDMLKLIEDLKQWILETPEMSQKWATEPAITDALYHMQAAATAHDVANFMVLYDQFMARYKPITTACGEEEDRGEAEEAEEENRDEAEQDEEGEEGGEGGGGWKWVAPHFKTVLQSIEDHELGEDPEVIDIVKTMQDALSEGKIEKYSLAKERYDDLLKRLFGGTT
ncbi:hypothetical protein LTR08_000409 [Meristemomyces frigidus]|nr:hypothetical protein LTR08_000409 [Meristemomyces frigidus]